MGDSQSLSPTFFQGHLITGDCKDKIVHYRSSLKGAFVFTILASSDKQNSRNSNQKDTQGRHLVLFLIQAN